MRGKRFSFPIERLLVLDVIRAARRVPSFPVDHCMQLSEVAEARQLAKTRISWPALFVRAYGLVCAEFPQLRQWYVTWPWRYVYEHEQSVAAISVNRRFSNHRDQLIWCRVISPERLPLLEIQSILDRSQTGELEEVFKAGCKFARSPWPLRQFIWWILMEWMPRKKAKIMGTFSLSTLAGLDATNRYHPLIFTSSLSYGAVDANGSCQVTMLCDHRTIDGVLAAEALLLLEKKLRGQILKELRSLRSKPTRRPSYL